jgi:anaerobic magnesium-protoporphyrin IX monomethyl ester cyclase
MRTVLVTRHADPQFPPLALLYLKAALVDAALSAPGDVRLLEFGPEAGAEAIAAAIEAEEPDVLGFSCHVWNVVDLMRAARLAAIARPGLRVVAGGPEVGADGARALSLYPALEVVVKGEGEAVFVELLGRWRAGLGVEDVAGICHRTGRGSCEHPDAPAVANLDQLPSPHARGDLDLTGRIACVETRRGCPFCCAFCYYGRGVRSAGRSFGLDRVTADLEFWLARDVHQIFLLDPVFNLDRRRAKAICRFLARRNVRRIPVHAEIRAELMDAELAALMKAAGFKYLEVGLQAIDERALASVGRSRATVQFTDGLGHLRDRALPFELQVIFGLPGDAQASHDAALDFAASQRPDYLSSFTLMVLPGTRLRRTAARLHVEFDPEPPYFVRSTSTLSEDDVRQGRRRSPAVRHLWNSGAIRWLHDRRGRPMSDILRRWDAWSAAAGGVLPTPASSRAFALDVCTELGIVPDFTGTFTRAEAEPCLRRLNRVLPSGP